MRRRCLIVAVACATVLPFSGALLVAPAGAAGPPPAVADCLKHGELTGKYSAAQLQQALNTMQAATAEYSNCPSVIQQALEAKIGKLHGGTGGSGGSFLPTWLLILLIVLVLGGAGLAGYAIRRRATPG